MKMDKLLPIGTLVLVKGSTDPAMIIATPFITDRRKYHYLVLSYLLVYYNDDLIVPINNEDIEEVLFYGYLDEESNHYLNFISKEM